ncbi:MAG: RluA family pseudouridine synthase [Defluviitaleaceae bacterium]|nr:RluA family pseudouridine synthase [Defluviitaleaceae bacterium]
MIHTLIVPPEADGLRADIFLSGAQRTPEEYVDKSPQSLRELPFVPTRNAAQKLLAAGHVQKVNRADAPPLSFEESCEARFFNERGVHGNFFKNSSEVLTKNYRVKSGDVIICKIPAPVSLEASAENIPLEIVYEDADLLVIDKPRGLVVHPGAGHLTGTLVNALLFHCELSGIGGVLRPGIVHRLDKDTSGLMVVAKNDAAHLALSAQLERREMGREYAALCTGVLKKDRLRIDLPIGRHPRDRKKMAVIVAPGARAREAATNIEVLERFKNHTLVAARLETGRTHQIRVHMAHIGHPVSGDATYGSSRGADGQILHARKIKFIHPTTGAEKEFSSPLPEYFNEALRRVKI